MVSRSFSLDPGIALSCVHDVHTQPPPHAGRESSADALLRQAEPTLGGRQCLLSTIDDFFRNGYTGILHVNRVELAILQIGFDPTIHPRF